MGAIPRPLTEEITMTKSVKYASLLSRVTAHAKAAVGTKNKAYWRAHARHLNGLICAEFRANAA